jgi:hypothetical protein
MEIVKKICENCGKGIRPSNYERHVKSCKRGRYKVKPKLCKSCGKYFKCGGRGGHFRRTCRGKDWKIEFKECRKCGDKISKSNLKRHEDVCSNDHKDKGKE